MTVSALCIALSFHPIKLHFLAWIGFVPLFYAAESAKPSNAFVIGILFGSLFALFGLFWLVFLQIELNIKVLMIFGLILLFLYYGIYYGVALLFGSRLGLWSFPLAVCGLELLRGTGEIGFPWLALGYSQARYPAIIQQASIYGVYGISLWIAATNVLVYSAIRSKKLVTTIAALLLFALPLVYGILAMRPGTEQPLHIGVIQPNIDPNLKFSHAMREETFNRLIHLSERCAADHRASAQKKLDCIVWPETATPVFLLFPGTHQQRVFDLCHRLGIPIFTGTPVYDANTKDIFNGAVLIIPDHGIQQEYRKIHLVPFGEHIPYDQYISAFRAIDVGGGDYRPGNTYTVFNLANATFSCLICFESIFPGLARRFTNRGAQVLVNITNDGWFGTISGPQQHNDMFILRAVESRVPLARSSNTGISMLVDRYGRVLKETPLFREMHISGTVGIVDCTTVYQTIGDALPLGALIIIACALILHVLKCRAVRTC